MVSSEIQRIRIPLGERFADLWLFVGPERALLFDTGVAHTMRDAVAPHLARNSIPPEKVEYVVVSHLDVDHSGDGGGVHATLPQARIVAHQGDAAAIQDWDTFLVERGREFAQNWGLDESPEAVEWMRGAFQPGPVDEILSQEREIDLGEERVLELWHLPGHSHGHLSVYDRTHDTLAISDAILGSFVPLADGSPSFPPTYRHVDDYLATISRVKNAAPHLLLTAHYGDYSGDEVQEFLHESAEFVHQMDQAVTSALSSDPHTLRDIVSKVNPEVATWPLEGTETALAFPVAGHLERARNAGVARAEKLDGVWHWTAA